MPVPTYDQLIEPLLRVLQRSPGGVDVTDAYEAVAEAVELTPEDKALLLPSGVQAVYKNRIGWAHDRLKRAGYSESPKRGLWRLTASGLALAMKKGSLSPEDIERIANASRESKARSRDAGIPAAPSGPELPPTSLQSPEERIGSAVRELRESVGRDLLELVLRCSPQFFERLVLDLLHAMGYGASADDLKPVGGSGDGGIDGIIYLDRLGLERVYVQAKRWKDKVGSPEIQGFVGALQLQGANKGVLLTTSRFTSDAVEAAKRARGSVVLVDGRQLAEMMMDHGVGTTHKAIKVPKVDSDYFEES